MTIYNDNIARPYVYKITFLETGQYYIGYREQNTKPARFDIGIIYFTSSEKIWSMGFKKFLDISKIKIEILAEFTENDVINIGDTPGDIAFDYEQNLIYSKWGDFLLLNGYYRHKNGELRFKSKKSTTPGESLGGNKN